MSVVGEIVGVIACVAGIVSAYHDGSAVIQKIKVKRAQKKAPPPPRLLEESIDQAPQEIEREKQRGVARFGRAFEEGDHIAVIALQQITIQLQASLLEKLRHAAFDDDHKITDFTYLVDAADLGRDRTIATMLEFRQRLLEAKPITEMQYNPPQPTVSHRPRNVLQSISESSPLQHSHPPKQTSPPPAPRHRTWTREYGATPVEQGDGENEALFGADDTTHSHRKRSSFLHFLKHHRGHSAADPKSPSSTSPTPDEGIRHSSAAATAVPFRPPTQCDVTETPSHASTPPQPRSPQPQEQPSQPQQRPQFTYQDWEDDPAAIWGSRPSMERRETLSIAPDALQPSSAQNSHHMTIHRTNSGSTVIPSPSPENEYLGFCKGAWKIQSGDRKGAFSKQREVEAWSRHPSGNANAYLACSHSRCAFRSHVNVEVIWDKAWSVPSKNLKFRWALLAKSHVTQRVVVRNQYTFQCMFCTFSGEKGRVYHGIEHYLDHISSEHRGQRLSELVLHKTNCINDRVAAEDDSFDINLWPLSAEEKQERRRSDGLKGELTEDFMRRNTDAADSMFSEEPWNEGLSDFRYHGDHDRTEFI